MLPVFVTSTDTTLPEIFGCDTSNVVYESPYPNEYAALPLEST